LTSAPFSFVSARKLVQLDVYNGGVSSSTVTLGCAGQSTVSVTLAAGALITLSTGWMGTCMSVTVTSSNGWDTNFDNLMIQ